MIETATLITLCLLYLIFFRPGTTPPLENPLVIERAGQYHMTLAPQLNLAQPFIEAVARGMAATRGETDNGATHCFEIYDKRVKARKAGCYLLAITQRNGMLYFQAAHPHATDGNLPTLRAYSDAVLARFPLLHPHTAAPDAALVSAVREVALQYGIRINLLHP